MFWYLQIFPTSFNPPYLYHPRLEPVSLSHSNSTHGHVKRLRQVLLEQPLKGATEFGFLSDPLILSCLHVSCRPGFRHNIPVNVLWHVFADKNVATFISPPRLIPESAVCVNSSVLEVKLLVAEHTGIEIGVESDLTNLDLFTELLVRELIDEVLVERLGLGKHAENSVA